MKLKSRLTATLLALAAGTAAFAQGTGTVNEGQTLIPQRAIILHGDPSRADSSVIAVFYSRENLDFSDADAPRLMLLDRDGKIAFGIGGSLYATASYDFGGSIDDYNFTTYDIQVPNNAEFRQRFGAGAQASSLTAKLVGKTKKFGLFKVYFQAKFTGDDGGYGFKLKQAYASVGHLTAGLTNSTFIDNDVQAPTIDPQGACGQVSEKSMIIRYATSTYKGFSGAISVELPKVSMTQNTFVTDGIETAGTTKIAQRVPDIPVYIQYSWAKGSHVRASAIFRDICYRDLLAGKNRFEAGWGVKGSFIFDIAGIVQPFGHVSYGKGISQFVNDLSGEGFDLIPDASDRGRLTVAPSMTWTGGFYVHFTPKLFATASVSRAQLFDCGHLGPDTYRFGMYECANMFYDVDDNLRLGAEYLHGTRNNYSGEHGKANRINVLLQYSF